VVDERDELKRQLEQRTRALEACEARFRNVINRNADAIIIVDGNGIVRFANSAAESLFDRRARDLSGVGFGFPVVVGETTEIDVLRRGGEVTIAEMRVVETEWENETAYLATLRDITDRKRAEQEREQFIREQAARAEAEAAGRRLSFLAEASMRLASSLDYEVTLADVARLAVPFLADYCLVDIITPDETLRQVAVAHTDAAKEELLGELRRRYPVDMSAPSGVAAVTRTGRPEMVAEITESQMRALARDDEHFELLQSLEIRSYLIVPMVARGRTLGTISLIASESNRHYTGEDLALAEDLARRAGVAIDNARLFRNAQEASQLRDEFLLMVSHELLTPLNPILGWAQMLRAGLDPRSAARALESIEQNSRHLTQIVRDLLDVTRIITGKLSIESAPTNLAAAVDAAIHSVRAAAQNRGVAIEKQFDAQAAIVVGEAARLQQVVWNLLSNAIKFTPRGGHILVRLDRQDGHYRVSVSDDGQGISADFLPYVFDRFRQADGSIRRRQGGLGLGLSLVRHLVEMHGGTVSAASDGEGKGAVFTIRLPRA
jgi:signal transduction histidine kinase